MPNQQTLNKLREAIIKEIPEIVELDFGCEVSHTSVGMWMHRASTGRYIFTGERKREDIGLFYKDIELTRIGNASVSDEFNKIILTAEEVLRVVKDKECILIGKKLAEKEFEVLSGWYSIIGRPITLADVLRVLSKEFYVWNIDTKLSTSSYLIKNRTTEKFCGWNMTKNALSLQIEETINFLADIILKKQ